MKVVLLAGGKGTRISEESIYRPKPMIEIANMPILWHIMKSYSYYGFNDFVICAGYKQEYIKEWFGNYMIRMSDVTFDFANNKRKINKSHVEPWNVTVVNTGLETMTGGRVKKIQEYIGDETFLLTYGDAVCDVDIADTVKFHKEHGKIATITSVIQKQQKGILDISDVGAVKSFREKQVVDGSPINAGYMVLSPKVFDYLNNDSDVFETAVLEKLAVESELMSYCHNGYWQCMDSLREKVILETLVERGKAPWIKWTD
jgi:glucose-1-phosphate cytidylyltransferase